MSVSWKTLKATEPFASARAAVKRAIRRVGALLRAAVGAPEPSGPAWVRRFPTSVDIGDLASPFAERAAAFVDALRSAGADVTIRATYRPKERAYLMHWAWRIGEDGFDPNRVPPMPGVAIRWTHKTAARSRAAARLMVAEYGMAQIAALDSRHIDGRAIDMTISWQGSLSIRRRDGGLATIDTEPRDGSNPELVAVGAGYGVFKLMSDPPHWSADGL